MNKFLIVLSHTYFSRLKSKAFIIITVIALLLIAGVANIQTFIDIFSSDKEKQIAVIDESGYLFDSIEMGAEQVLEDVAFIPYDESVEKGKEAVRQGEYISLMVLQADENKFPEVTYYANNVTDSMTLFTLEQQVQQVKVILATEQAGIDPVMLEQIYEPVYFEKIALDDTAKTDDELNAARGIVYVMLFVLYTAVMIYGQMIATDVATEKSSRVMEILISSASPVTHMFGKILGIALLGLTQLGLFMVVGYGMFTIKADDFTGEFFEVFGFGATSFSIYIYAILFFILGYFLYATIAAMLGSLVSRVEDAQQLILPMTFLIMIAFLIAMFGLSAPDSTFIKITSFIPFFSPMIMFLRVGMLEVPFWEIALSIGLLITTIILLAMLGARIYRGGVLMYGPSRSLKDLKRAFLLTKKE